MADGGGGGPPPAAAAALKDQGNEQFKAGSYLKAAALYTQAIKLDPDNATLYSNRAAAFLQLVKLSKALADAETTVKLKPQWEKGHFRKGCVFEAMERYEEAIAAFQIALQHNPQNTEVSRKIKRLSQLAREKKRALDVESMRSNVDISKNLESLRTELAAKYGVAENWQSIFSFVVNVIESAIKVWHDTGKVDPRVNFLLDDQKTDTEKYAPIVNIDKAFESPNTHAECFTYLRHYADNSIAKAACMVASKSIISYPQVWKGQGSRKWKLDQSDGFFVQFESPALRKIWFVPSTKEKGRTLCKSPETLDISIHEVLPPSPVYSTKQLSLGANEQFMDSFLTQLPFAECMIHCNEWNLCKGFLCAEPRDSEILLVCCFASIAVLYFGVYTKKLGWWGYFDFIFLGKNLSIQRNW